MLINHELAIKPYVYLLIYIVLFAALASHIIFFFINQQQFANFQYIEVEETILSIQPGQFGTNFVGTQNFVLTPKDSLDLSIGDKIRFSGNVVCPHAQSCSKPRLYKPTIKVLSTRSNNLLLKASIGARNQILQTYSNGLKRDQANLMSGIVIGNISLGSSFKNRLATVGLTHIVAASGMNVTLVAGFLTWVFTNLRLRKSLNLILSAGILFFYCGITGFAPPIVRALLMCLAIYLGKFLGRKNSGFWSLIWAAYLMLWVDVGLIINLSFLLSLGSMIGQISVSNIEIRLPNLIRPISEILIQTGAAIIFTFPIVMMGFSTFSLVSMISNLLVIWTVEPLMILGGFAGIVGFTSMELAKIILIPADIMLDYFLFVVKILSNENFLFKFQGFNFLMSIGYYVFLGSAYYYLIYLKRSKN